MPNTPEVRFNFKNNNVQPSVPLLGVTHVVARTTKGPFNKPDEVFRTYTAFQRVYGEEKVPDGSISNIKKAFELGSTLRISRVEGKDGPTFGVAKTIPTSSGVEAKDAIITIVIKSNDGTGNYKLNLGIQTREAGSPIIDNDTTKENRTFYLRVFNTIGVDSKYYIGQYTDNEGLNMLTQNMFFQSSAPSMDQTFINANAFVDFMNNAENIEFIFKSATDDEGEAIASIKSMDDVISLIRNNSNSFGYIELNGVEVEVPTDPTKQDSAFMLNELLSINEGTNGGESDADTWVKAYEAIKAYNDSYQLICSHIHQHIDDYLKALSTIAKDVSANFETMLFVEIPKKDSEGVRTPEGVVNFLKEALPTIGYSKSVAYFGGGLKYYNENGALMNCDVLGSVVGLGDKSATEYGPWYSFSGMNRGTLPDAVGPVMENVGAPALIDKLKNIAEWFGNVFVIKDTSTQGKQTMLWNGFTSHVKSDSERFINIVRLNLYLKKNIRPILESFLEEPNSWSTWRQIYYRVRPIFEDLEDRNAIVPGEWQWLGDQDATSFEDLEVNNEPDVRQGKYKAIFKYKEITSLQEIEMNIQIDAVNQSVTITD